MEAFPAGPGTTSGCKEGLCCSPATSLPTAGTTTVTAPQEELGVLLLPPAGGSGDAVAVQGVGQPVLVGVMHLKRHASA